MRYLTEAGVDTSKLDMAARPVVDAVIGETVAQMMSRDLPANHISPKEAGQSSQAFARILKQYQTDPTKLLQSFCIAMSERLTKLVQTIIEREMGGTFHTVMLGSFSPSDVSVNLIPSSQDVVKGSLDEPNKTIMMHFGVRRLLLPLMAVFGKEAFGLTVTNGYDMLRTQIVGILVHEYAHLIQDIMRGDKPANLGKDPDDIDINDVAHHLGTPEEIDSFASQAVAELTYTIDSHHADPEAVLDEIRHSLSVGANTGSRTYNVYMTMLRNTFSGHYPTLDPQSIGKTWRRFVKAVWTKLRSYYPDKRGKSHSTQNMRPQWVNWARRLPRSAFVIWLAGHVADDLIDNKPRHVSFEQLIDAVSDDTTGLTQHEAEHFIENYYFGYASFDPHAGKLINIFRRVVKRKLMRHMAQMQTKKAA